MSRKTVKARRDQMLDMIVKASGYIICQNELKFKYHDPLSNDYIYAIFMPVAQQWEDFRVNRKFIINKTLPMHVVQLIDQISQMAYVMTHARDAQVFTDDIRAISPEERRRFGTQYYTLERYKAILDSITNKLNQTLY